MGGKICPKWNLTPIPSTFSHGKVTCCGKLYRKQKISHERFQEESLESSRTSTMDLLCKKALSWIFHWFLGSYISPLQQNFLYDHKITGFVKARKTFPRMQLTGQMKIDKEKQQSITVKRLRIRDFSGYQGLFFYSLFKVDITNIIVILLIYNILMQIDSFDVIPSWRYHQKNYHCVVFSAVLLNGISFYIIWVLVLCTTVVFSILLFSFSSSQSGLSSFRRGYFCDSSCIGIIVEMSWVLFPFLFFEKKIHA